MTAVIAAVIPDFALYFVETAIKPTIYLDGPESPHRAGIMHILLSGRDIPATLSAIDQLWTAT